MTVKNTTRREVMQKTLYAVGALSLVKCGGTPVGATNGTADLATANNSVDAATLARDAATNATDAGVAKVDAGSIACTLTAEQEEGPYYLSLGNIRSNITESKPGVPLALTFTIVDTTTCEVLPNAAIDIWHCDASGVYSGFSSEGTLNETYLRGTLLTDTNGTATFTSIMPGWYSGRAVHIHMKVRIAGTASGASYAGGHVSHTGQLFFAQTLISSYQTLTPYSANTTALTLNASDDVWTSQDGSAEVANVSGSTTAGFAASITLGVNPPSTPSAVGVGGSGGTPGGH